MLLSAKDGTVIRNLTKGFTGKAYESHRRSTRTSWPGAPSPSTPRATPWPSSPARASAAACILVSVLDGDRARSASPSSWTRPRRPACCPTASRRSSPALQEGVADIYDARPGHGRVQEPDPGRVLRLRPPGLPRRELVVYTRRVSGHDKIYAFPLANPARKTQLTFGAHDDDAPIFSADGERVYYSSNEDDDIFNLRSLDLKTGVIRQYTDALGGNMAPGAAAGQGRRARWPSSATSRASIELHSIDLATDREGGRAGRAGGRRGDRRLPARRRPPGGGREQAAQARLREACSWRAGRPSTWA